MGRPQVHSEDSILDAARDLVLEGGARSTTVTAIAAASGAPKGSIYHRFNSLDDLLAEMWIRAVRRSQREFVDALRAADPMEAAIAGALALHDFAEREPADAGLLASLRRGDLMARVESRRLRRELKDLNRPLEAAITDLARRLFGRAGSRTVAMTIFAVVDIPMGGLRRFLVEGTRLPKTLRAQLEAAVRAALVQAGAG